jgi:polar amino acid transport system substrate-binding protein
LRNNTDLIILSIDIDFFKKINDHYGHAVGDQMLKLITKTISSHLRKTDLFGRIGGEEFIILLQSTSLKHAQLLCKKINVSVASTILVLENKEPIHTTVSIGLASLNSSDATLEQIIKRSDQALYKAKEQGRNRIIEC